MNISIPPGRLSNTTDEAAAAARRRAIRAALSSNQPVKVNQQGNVELNPRENSSTPSIVVPEGKLAAFHWYQRDLELFDSEKVAMRRYFPQFKLVTLSDGRLSWTGYLDINATAPPTRWLLELIYENNHPNNSTYGGSIKVYPIDPDLNSLQSKLGHSIPHVLRDSQGEPYLCTARTGDFRASYDHSTSAASALAWASKWINAFELWCEGDLTTEEFAGHGI